MGSQLDLFAAPAPSGPPPCPHHGPEFICPACAECGDTDGCGFLHRQVCGGRIPLRACRQCGQLRTHGRWSHADYWRCLDCVPLGSQVLSRRSPALANNRQSQP